MAVAREGEGLEWGIGQGERWRGREGVGEGEGRSRVFILRPGVESASRGGVKQLRGAIRQRAELRRLIRHHHGLEMVTRQREKSYRGCHSVCVCVCVYSCWEALDKRRAEQG